MKLFSNQLYLQKGPHILFKFSLGSIYFLLAVGDKPLGLHGLLKLVRSTEELLFGHHLANEHKLLLLLLSALLGLRLHILKGNQFASKLGKKKKKDKLSMKYNEAKNSKITYCKPKGKK